MLDKSHKPLIAVTAEKDIHILPRMLNRHGLITGATGTGKTVSLQTLAESFSALGIPVFMADVKGDLSGVGAPGKAEGKPGQRVREFGLEDKGWHGEAFPVCFWDVFAKNGHPLRATVSDLGPLLLARLLNLNDVQTGVLQLIFKIADDNNLLLLDLKDLQKMTQFVGDEREQFRTSYGQISAASIGAIQRALLRLEEQGAKNFFGEPALQIQDLLQTDGGKGIINILDATSLVNSPELYSCVLLWLLSELYERLPEAGDLEKPRLVFFFDEAHLLFNGIAPVLLQKIEQIARLIRSRGVGIFFVSQNPSDIPDSVLGQLGNRVQHALRAFTPKDQKAVRAAAQAFRPNPAFSTSEAIGQLGVGEALVSFLDENGTPEVVDKAFIVPPQSHIGPVDQERRKQLIKDSLLAGIYEKSLDRVSAYEILTERAQNLQREKEEQARVLEEEKERKKALAARKQPRATRQVSASEDPFGVLLNSVIRTTATSASRSVGRELGKSILRGLLGGLMGKK